MPEWREASFRMELYATHSTATRTERLAELPVATAFRDPEPPSAFMKLCLQDTVTSYAQEPGVVAMVLPPFLLKRDGPGLDLNEANQVVGVLPRSWAAAAGVACRDTIVQANEQLLDGRTLSQALASLHERDVEEVHLVLVRRVTTETPPVVAGDVPVRRQGHRPRARLEVAEGVPMRTGLGWTGLQPKGHADVTMALSHARAQQAQEHSRVQEQRRQPPDEQRPPQRKQPVQRPPPTKVRASWYAAAGSVVAAATALRTPLRRPLGGSRAATAPASAAAFAPTAAPTTSASAASAASAASVASAASAAPTADAAAAAGGGSFPLHCHTTSACLTSVCHAHTAAVNALAWAGGPGAAASSLLASASADGGLLLWSSGLLEGRTPRPSLLATLRPTRGHGGLQALCALSGGGLASAGADGHLVTWDVAAERQVTALGGGEGHTSWAAADTVWAVAAPPASAHSVSAAAAAVFASAGADGVVRL